MTAEAQLSAVWTGDDGLVLEAAVGDALYVAGGDDCGVHCGTGNDLDEDDTGPVLVWRSRRPIVVRVASLDAVIFDLDGVLIDSEPFWQEAEMACFAEVGLHVEEPETRQTMGLRIEEAVAYWYDRRPWPGADHPGHATLVGRILDRVEELILTRGEPLPGTVDAVAACEKLGLRRAVASSSKDRIIAAALRRLGLADRFEVVRSAEHESYGKPHPAVFLRTAAELGVEPTRCLVVEDSFHGMVAALAARMRCVVIPEVPGPRFAAADRELASLGELPTLLGELRGNI